MKIGLAFRAFFNLLFGGELSDGVLADLGLTKKPAAPPKPVAPPPPAHTTADGALQFLGILQRDSRLVDFLMEDIKSYSDDQVGAAVRELHDQCRDAVARYVTLQPVIDGVEGTFAKAPSSRPQRRQVCRQRSREAAGGRHAAAQRLARGQDRSARTSGPTGRGNYRARGNRN